jgi:diguanylate cyclase (GGDEF)-like protein
MAIPKQQFSSGSDPLPTEFAPAERTERETLLRQQQLWLGNEGIRLLGEAVPNVVLVLNNTRQIVYANSYVKIFGDFVSPQSYLGLRPGELVNCIHANENLGGCGTTSFCRTCGAANAILTSLIGNADVEECSIERTSQNDYLELRVLTTPVQLGGEDFVVFSIQDIRLEKENQRLLEEVQRLAILDPLTGVNNRRAFFEEALREFSRGVRYQRPMAVIMFDADRFKTFNDTLGHPAGDTLLRSIALTIRANLRDLDLFARYGGDEFIALLPETNLAQASAVARRIVDLVSAMEMDFEGSIRQPTITAGVAAFDPSDPSLDVLIARADADLLQQKRQKQYES